MSIARGLDSFDGGEREFRGWCSRSPAAGRSTGLGAVADSPRVGVDGVDVADVSGSAASLVDAAAALAAALTLLGQLTPDQREVVALRVIVGMSVGETAAVVGKTEGAVRVVCHRALRTLAERLNPAELVDEVAT